MDQNSVTSQNAGYRRGVIFGLTMAEILLMLLFSLLTAMYFLSKETDDLRNELETASAHLDQVNAEHENLKVSLVVSRRENEILRVQLSQSRVEVEDLRSKNEELVASLEERIRESDNLQAQLSRSRVEVEGLRSENDILVASLDDSNRERERLKRQNSQRAEQIGELPEEAWWLRSLLEESILEQEYLQRQLSRRTAQSDELRTAVAQLRTSLEEGNRERENLQEQLILRTEQAENLRIQTTELRTLLEERNLEHEYLQRQLSRKSMQADELRTTVAELRTSLKEGNHERQILQEQLAMHVEQADNLRTEIAELRTSLEDGDRENDSLRTQLSQGVADADSLRSEISELRISQEENESANERLQRQLIASTEVVEGLRTENERLQAEVGSLAGLDPDLARFLLDLGNDDPEIYEQFLHVAAAIKESGTESMVLPRSRWNDLTITEQMFSEIAMPETIISFDEEQREALVEAIKNIDSGIGNNREPPGAELVNWPPIINLEEAQGFTFRRGSAVLGDSFTRNLETDVLERVKSVVDQYGVRVVEVVGHTDEEPVGTTRISNLDLKAIPALHADAGISNLEVSDNAGLGLARAISVTRVLQRLLAEDPEYNDVIVLPYSAGHVIGLNERVSLGVGTSELSDQNRRRIEIRLRRSSLARQLQ